MPPIGGGTRADNEYQLAIIPAPGSQAPPLSPAMPPALDASANEIVMSQTHAQTLRRIKRMYIERVIRDSEKLAYDERVDMRSSVSHPMAQVANALAYTAVVSYWVIALTLTSVYSVYLNSRDAIRWVYAVLS